MHVSIGTVRSHGKEREKSCSDPQIANWGTYRHDCTPYACEASRKRRRGVENEEK